MNTDTIVASATAPGRGAISVIRLSGPDALAIASRCQSKRLTPRVATFSPFISNGIQLDSGLWIYFPAPHSFTGENTVEFQGHGGPTVIQSIIQTLVDQGARLAQPGEFSERAFLNGKIDLTQAEAISDLIAASSIEAVKAANRSLAGEFGDEIRSLVDQIVHLRTHLEAHIDFPDEDISPQALEEFGLVLKNATTYLATLLERARLGSKLNQAADIVLIGTPNTGKSSLLNTLAKEPLAIVTDLPGTTRDLIRHHIVTHGLELRITDTAGLRTTDDPIEREGIQRTKQAIATADLIIAMFDETHLEITDRDVSQLIQLEALDTPILVVRNKMDLYSSETNESLPYAYCQISAMTGDGIDELLAHIRSILQIIPRDDVFLARTRHINLLDQASACFLSALDHPLQQEFIDLIAEDLRLAQNALSEITGAFNSDDLLTEIFSNFCIGK